MKPYKWKKGDGITTVCIIIGAILGFIGGIFYPSLLDEILHKFIEFTIVIVVILSPIIVIIRIAMKF